MTEYAAYVLLIQEITLYIGKIGGNFDLVLFTPFCCLFLCLNLIIIV